MSLCKTNSRGEVLALFPKCRCGEERTGVTTRTGPLNSLFLEEHLRSFSTQCHCLILVPRTDHISASLTQFRHKQYHTKNVFSVGYNGCTAIPRLGCCSSAPIYATQTAMSINERGNTALFSILICTSSICLLDNSWLIILLLVPISRNQIMRLLFTPWTDWGKKYSWLAESIPLHSNNTVI